MPSEQPVFQILKPKMGIRKDIPATEIGFGGLVDAKNWIYRNSNFYVRPGLTDFANDVNERPLGFIQYDWANDIGGSEEDRLVMGTDDGWHHYNSGAGTWTNITGGVLLTGGNSAQVVFRTFESGNIVKLLGVNGADNCKIWTGTGNYASLGGTPPSAPTAIAVAQDRVLLAQGDTVYYSANLDETDWTEGSFRIAETPGDIVAMLEFGTKQTAVYKENSIYMLYAQVDLTKRFRSELKRANTPGPVSPAALFGIGELGIHCYLSESGAVMLFDGHAPVSMGNHIQTHIRQTRDYDLRTRSHGFYDPIQNEIYVFYATAGASDVNSCIVINFETRAFHYYIFDNHTISMGFPSVLTDGMTVGDFPAFNEISLTFGEMDRGSNGILLADAGGQVYHHSGLTDDGFAIQHYFETGLESVGERHRYGLIQHSDHLFGTASASQNVAIQFGASNYGETPTYETSQTVDIGAAGPYWLGHRVPGRLFSIKMSGSSSYETYYIGSDINAVELGLR